MPDRYSLFAFFPFPSEKLIKSTTVPAKIINDPVSFETAKDRMSPNVLIHNETIAKNIFMNTL